jgi:hypothetical protein
MMVACCLSVSCITQAIFCGNATNGTIVANGNPHAKEFLGTTLGIGRTPTARRTVRKSSLQRRSRKGQITEISGYLFPRPNDPKPVPKNSFVARVGDLYCGVGYYK